MDDILLEHEYLLKVTIKYVHYLLENNHRDEIIIFMS